MRERSMRSTRKLRKSWRSSHQAPIRLTSTICHRDRPDRAMGLPPSLIAIVDRELARVVDRTADLGEVDAGGGGSAALRDIERRLGEIAAQHLRKNRRHLGKDALGGPLQNRVAETAHMARTDRDRIDLIRCEHQRRQVEAAAQHIADAGGALDRDPARLQGRDVAVDRASRDLEPVGERRRGQRARRAVSG